MGWCLQHEQNKLGGRGHWDSERGGGGEGGSSVRPHQCAEIVMMTTQRMSVMTPCDSVMRASYLLMIRDTPAPREACGGARMEREANSASKREGVSIQARPAKAAKVGAAGEDAA